MRFWIPGKPIAQGRPRFARSSGRAYDPAKSRGWKQFVAYRANFTPCEPFPKHVPLSMSITFHFLRPLSSKKDFPTVRPDLTNLAKGVEDSLNGICYHDDSQLVRVTLTKIYSDKEGVDVCIEEM